MKEWREWGLENLENDSRPIVALIDGQVVQVGDRVELHPSSRADAFDMMLEGKTARIEAIQEDFEDRIYLVVTLDDDPGRDQEDDKILPGHRFFFFLHEVKLLDRPSEEIP